MVDSSSLFDFGVMFMINVGAAIFMLVLFCLIHRTSFFKRLHNARHYTQEEGIPVKPTEGPFSWIIPVWMATEDDIIKWSGLDAAIYIRLFTFSIQLFVLVALLCLPILVPVNATGKHLGQLPASSGSLDHLSMSNVGTKANRLWAHFSVLYVISAITIGLVWWHYDHVWRLRHKFLKSRAQNRQPEEYTLLVTDIPSPRSLKSDSSVTFFANSGRGRGISVSRSSASTFFHILQRATMGYIKTPRKVQTTAILEQQAVIVDQFFRRLYPGMYLKHESIHHLRKVTKAFNRWKTAVKQLDRARWRLAKRHEVNNLLENPVSESELEEKRRLGFCGCWGRQVAAIPWWEEQVKERNQSLIEKQAVALKHRSTNAAFISFKNRRVATVAAQTNHSTRGAQWRLQMAPQPEDVLWGNVELQLWDRTLRKSVSTILFVALVLFMYIPVTFIAGLTSLKHLVKWLPFLKAAVKDEWFHGVLSSLLPGLALRIILWCIPPLLMVLARAEGEISFSAVQRNAAARHYYVLLFNVFLGSTFTDTLLSQLQVIIDHPQDLVKILATSLPQASSFFITYVVISGVLFGIELLRMPIPIIGYLVKVWTVGFEVGDREKIWSQGGIQYHVFMPYQNLIVTFGLVFAVVAPLILPFVLLYSAIGYFVWKHQVMYIYSYPYQSGGRLWPHFVDHVFVALFLAQLTVIGEFGLKQAYYQAAWSIPLPVLTLYLMSMINSQFKATFNTMPLEVAADVDDFSEQCGFRPTAEDFTGQYVPLCLRPPQNPPLGIEHGKLQSVLERAQSSPTDLEADVAHRPFFTSRANSGRWIGQNADLDWGRTSSGRDSASATLRGASDAQGSLVPHVQGGAGRMKRAGSGVEEGTQVSRTSPEHSSPLSPGKAEPVPEESVKRNLNYNGDKQVEHKAGLAQPLPLGASSGSPHHEDSQSPNKGVVLSEVAPALLLRQSSRDRTGSGAPLLSTDHSGGRRLGDAEAASQIGCGLELNHDGSRRSLSESITGQKRE